MSALIIQLTAKDLLSHRQISPVSETIFLHIIQIFEFPGSSDLIICLTEIQMKNWETG